ncbi:MAG: hypothetical protein MI806_08105 [Minwuiales bacterium]|nr:hypothetical protein [Minwuiales bacterium]
MSGNIKFSVAFWNIENFWGKAARTVRVARHLKSIRADKKMPDVVAFCEIKDKGRIRDVIQKELSDYDFGLTDTGGSRASRKEQAEIELLVGWRRGLFDQTIFTQRVDLKAGREGVRPGALLNVRAGRTWYSLLFLHTKSGPDKSSYATRRKTFARLWRLKAALKRLDKTKNHTAGSRLLVMGDLNTMGNGAGVSGKTEVRNLKRDAVKNGMDVPAKEHDLTFGQKSRRGGRLESDLDHVLTHRVRLRSLGRRDGKAYYVAVRGWNQLTDDPRKLREYEKTLSDHSALYVEVV